MPTLKLAPFILKLSKKSIICHHLHQFPNSIMLQRMRLKYTLVYCNRHYLVRLICIVYLHSAYVYNQLDFNQEPNVDGRCKLNIVLFKRSRSSSNQVWLQAAEGAALLNPRNSWPHQGRTLELSNQLFSPCRLHCFFVNEHSSSMPPLC